MVAYIGRKSYIEELNDSNVLLYIGKVQLESGFDTNYYFNGTYEGWRLLYW